MNQPIRQVGGALLSVIVGVSSLAVLASPAQAAPPARITGTITVAGGGVLAGVKVTALRLADTGEWAEADTAMSGADGRYQIGKFDTGTYRIRFDDPSGGYQTEFYDDQPRVDLAQDISLVKGGGKVEHIDAELGAAAHLAGRVTGSSQQGIADAVVTAYVRQGADWVEFQHVNTAADGTYDLGGLPGGVYTLGFADAGSGVSEFWNDRALLADADPISVSNSGTTSGLNAELATPLPPAPDPVPASDPTTPSVTPAPAGAPAPAATATADAPAAATAAVRVSVVTKPRIKGAPRVDQRLRVTRGAWNPTAVSRTIQWLANGKKIKHATKARLRLTGRLVGKRITVRVTASAPGMTALTVKTASKRVKR